MPQHKVMWNAYTAKNKLRGTTALWLTTAQTAEILGISQDQVRVYVHTERLRGIKRSSRILVSRGSVERFVSFLDQQAERSRPKQYANR